MSEEIMHIEQEPTTFEPNTKVVFVSYRKDGKTYVGKYTKHQPKKVEDKEVQ